jgi:ribonucleoside-diphosphate reductase alpha chain
MYHSINPTEDLLLKQVITDRFESGTNAASFAWRDILPTERRKPITDIIVTRGDKDTHFSLEDVADAIGESLADLLIARREDEKSIFSDVNRRFVSDVAHAVAASLTKSLDEGGRLRLSEGDLYLLIEKALLENDAYDVAKSLAFRRSMEKSGSIDVHNGPQTLPVRLIRRNGNVVPWSETKIEIAVRKAFLTIKENPEPAIEVARGVTERIRRSDEAFIHIEAVQDMVQEELMRQGYFKAAEHYILYRAQRARLREEAEASAEDPNQEFMVTVTTDDGQSTFWDGTELKKRISFASIGLDLDMPEVEIERELRRSVGSEITEKDLKQTIILNAKALIEKDADFNKFAGRILLSYIYEEVLDWSIAKDGIEKLKDAHKAGFKSFLKHGVAIKRLHPELLEKYNLDKLADAFDPTADLDFDYLGIQTMYDRYLIVDKTGTKPRRLETPQYFWMRVSMGLFKHEPKDAEQWAIRLYNLYKGRRFCSSTPTLFNSGTLHSQLSSCYLYKVDDSIESIMQRGIAENADLSKWAGGLGGSWTAVRGTGGYIQGTNGESQGIIPFLKLHNDQLVAVNQGGKRRGSGCAYLETWHNDIEDFLELRKNTGDERRRCHDMNTANWIPDLFMKRMEDRGTWSLFRANEVPDLHDLYGKAFEQRYTEYEAMAAEGKIWSRQMPALELWKAMLKMVFETGHPWITFKDPCNVRSPQDHCGVIHSSNLCTEITLNTGKDETAVCNLGSVILDSHITADGALDHDMLKETITVAIRALDNVIDINFYPTEAAKTANSRHRPIGLGVKIGRAHV